MLTKFINSLEAFALKPQKQRAADDLAGRLSVIDHIRTNFASGRNVDTDGSLARDKQAMGTLIQNLQTIQNLTEDRVLNMGGIGSA